ncbi:MAG: TetR family transcriptional regulator [Sulfurimonas sp.]|nr:MAG: TetR family transcriptional regulator [Sulfurimonas sp.]
MNTKQKILQTALRLFNEVNTQMATTNHIAKAMGISPGNLHYHYKNREEIIRILYKQMREKMSLSIEQLPSTIDELHKHQEDLLEVFWEYRFFYKELLFLFSRDEELEKMYISDNLRHRQRILKSINNFVENGDIILLNDKSLEYITDSILMTIQFYISYIKTLGQDIDKNSIKESIKYIDTILLPFIKTK